MGTRRIVPLLVLSLLATMLGGLVAVPAASAQLDQQTLVTCAAYNTAVSTGGQGAATAADELRAIGAPNPPGIENALDVIIDAEADQAPSGSRPSPEAIDAAIAALDGYFGPICQRTLADTCGLVADAVAEAGSSDSAALLRQLEAPSPPGIDAALAVLSGEITVGESPFHSTLDEAIEQIQDYYPCPTVVAPANIVELCADLSVLGIPEGPRAIAAAERVRAFGAPNPDVIDDALDVIIGFAQGTRPGADADSAVGVLFDFYADDCGNIDRCPLVSAVVGANVDEATEAASLLRRLETPSPPGIDAALALIAGEIDESPFHNSVAEAKQQINDYYMCVTLAFTGPSSAAPLAATGFGLLASGVVALGIRRRLDR